jgi:hypothetical protein
MEWMLTLFIRTTEKKNKQWKLEREKYMEMAEHILFENALTLSRGVITRRRNSSRVGMCQFDVRYRSLGVPA